MLLLHRSSPVLPNSNQGSITYLNTNSVLSRVAIQDLLRTREGHRILISSPSWHLPNPSVRTLYPEDRGGYEHLQPTGHLEAMNPLVKMGRTVA